MHEDKEISGDSDTGEHEEKDDDDDDGIDIIMNDIETPKGIRENNVNSDDEIVYEVDEIIDEVDTKGGDMSNDINLDVHLLGGKGGNIQKKWDLESINNDDEVIGDDETANK